MIVTNLLLILLGITAAQGENLLISTHKLNYLLKSFNHYYRPMAFGIPYLQLAFLVKLFFLLHSIFFLSYITSSLFNHSSHFLDIMHFFFPFSLLRSL